MSNLCKLKGNRRKSPVFSALLLVILLPLLTACNSQPTYPHVSLQGPLVNSTSPTRSDQAKPLRIVLASITSPQESRIYYDDMLNYLGKQLGMPIEIIQRKTYAEANDLVRAGSADMAFVCTYAYALGHDEFGMQLLAAPVIQGQTTYNAYIITSKDSTINSFAQLQGKTFAFTDPLSNTGTLYPLALVKSLGSTPDNFFSKYFYTYSHDYAIQAVADKLAEGASVDSTVYNYLRDTNSPIISKVKVIRISPPFGMPPVVVRPDLDPDLKTKIQEILLNMDQTAAGRQILANLHIDRFTTVHDADYDGVRQLAQAVSNYAK